MTSAPQPQQTPAAATTRFFNVVLPQLVLREFHTFLEQQGTITFDVTGAGQWSFTFGTEEPVVAGLKEKPGLALTFTQKAFDGFLDGSLDIAAAVQAREVTAKGDDFMLLEAFGRLLHPPARDLGWDTVG